jgi:hypothetical protein
MGATSSKLHTKALKMSGEHTNADLHSLVMDGQFQAQITDRAFQIIVHEDLPHYWALQLDLLIALKFIFDRIRPTEATVIFPNMPLRHPRGDTEVLLKMTTIQSVEEGLQMWIEHLAQKGSVQITDCDWQTAFQQSPQGYRIIRTQSKEDAHSSTTNLSDTLLRRSMIDKKQRASDEMTETIGKVFNKCQLTQDVSDEALKDTIKQTARDLLPRYMEPIPLDFAINNYGNLIKTSYDAKLRIGLGSVAFQAIVDAKETFLGGFGSKVKIVIVKGIMSQAHINILSKARVEVQNLLNDYNLKGKKSERLGSYGVCFAGLPGTGPGEVWRKLSGGNSDKRFCDYVDLPADSASYAVGGSLVRRLLLGSVV